MVEAKDTDRASDTLPLCVACGGGLRFFGNRLKYTYHQCTGCGTLQLVPIPTREELEQAYLTEYASAGHCDGDPDTRRVSAAPYYAAILRAFEKHGGRGPVLDHGAGWGGLCELFIQKGYECTGVEPSQRMADHCASLQLPVTHGDFWDAGDGPFGAILMSAVFEHLCNYEQWLMHAREVLAPEGLIVSMQPTAPFATFMGQLLRAGMRGRPLPQLHQVFCPPWHTVLFSFEGMQRLFERHGFTLEAVYPGPQGRSPGLLGLSQRMLGALNAVGWPLFGRHWPLLICHIFVLRKR